MQQPPEHSKTKTVLQEIIEHKKGEVRIAAAAESLTSIRQRAAEMSAPRDFVAALHNAKQQKRLPVIAEIKHKSPSAGVLRTPFLPAEIAKQYQQGGAACLSVLTDAEYFGGDIAHLTAARDSCDLPVLRKDFMIDEWQIYESRAMGADAVLLLAAVLSVAQMQSMAAIAADLGMAILFEVHTAKEAAAAIAAADNSAIRAHTIMGINNRDLASFNVSLENTVQLLPLFENTKHFVVSESGIRTSADIRKLQDAGAQGFLIGSAFMKAENPGTALQTMFA